MRKNECPHCGWTPEEQDKLSNDREDLMAALYAIVEKTSNTYASEEGRLCNALTKYMAQIAQIAINKAEGK